MTSPLNAFLISRRRMLQGGGPLSRRARGPKRLRGAAKPLTFIGWQYHPEIVDQNVDTFKKLYDKLSPTSSCPATITPWWRRSSLAASTST